MKFLASLAIVLIFMIGLSTPLAGLPGLGDILNPYDGIYETARLAIQPERAEIRSDFVSAEVTVLRNNFGVPHIFAETDEDLAYALGYVHAQDRLWQMDMQRRVAEGKLAEILGEEYVEQDKLMRRLGLAWSAERAVNNLKGEPILDLLEAYCKGVNKRMEEGKLPLEFKLLHYEPFSWTLKDTMAISKLISWMLSGTLQPIDRQRLAEKLGGENVWEELFPEETPYFKPIHDPPYPYAESAENGIACSNGEVGSKLNRSLDGAKDLLFSLELGLNLGSNNWVVAAENSKTNYPILASDPHLSLPLPATWYQVYSYSKEGYNTAGVTLPGVPVVLIGVNKNIAWGLTNISADDTDFYTYEIDPDTGKYLYDNEWLDFEEEEITIRVRGSEDVRMVLKRTVHGSVVQPGDEPIAMKWTGHESWTEAEAMLKINKAKNLAEFEEGLRYWHCPPQNFVYADEENIAMFSNGWYPIRKEGVTGLGVENGSDPEYDWKGFVPFEEIPYTINPDEGYLSSANQDPVTENYPYYLGRFFAPGYRGRRIDNLLASKKYHGIDDFKDYHSDIFSESAKSIIPVLLSVTCEKDLEPLAERGLDVLDNWDYEMRENESAPLIWTIFEMTFFRNIFEDEYERAGAQGLPLPRSILGEKIVREEPNSVWFDNVYTSERENRDDIMVRSIEEAMNLIGREFGENLNEWKWGNVNKLYFEHLSGLDVFSRGPYAACGGRDTLKVAPPSEVHPDLKEMVEGNGLEFRVKHGQSWRMVVSPGESYFGIYPGGQSSNPLSKHYDDMLKKYLEFEYNELVLPESIQAMREDMIESKLLFLPRE